MTSPTDRNTRITDFYQFAGAAHAEVFQLVARKYADYGPDNINASGAAGVLIRLTDKMNRLYNLVGSPDPGAVAESIEDTWKDVIGYGLIGLLLKRGLWPDSPLPVTAASGSTGGIHAEHDESHPDCRLAPEKRPITMVYLAGPIDAVHDSRGWRDDAIDRFHERGVSTFSPAHAHNWDGNSHAAKSIYAINRNAVLHCDAMLAFLPTGPVTIGTPIEIAQAWDAGKKVVVWTDAKCPSLVLMALGVPTAEYLETAINLLLG